MKVQSWRRPKRSRTTFPNPARARHVLYALDDIKKPETFTIHKNMSSKNPTQLHIHYDHNNFVYPKHTHITHLLSTAALALITLVDDLALPAAAGASALQLLYHAGPDLSELEL